jgi:phospholipase C
VNLTRRKFLGSAGAAGVLAATGGWRYSARAGQLVVPPPAPERSGIEHIVVVMMENRSFDHFLGWLPGADGRQAGLTFRDAKGQTHGTYSLSGEYNGCAHPDPDHSYEGGRAQYDHGAMDGWLHNGSGDDVFGLGYYGAADRPFMSRLALNYTTLDRYFCSILAETYPNRFFMHAATTDRLHNMGTTMTSLSPTIWDRLSAKGVSARYYFSDLPFLALWGTKYLSTSAHYTQFLTDAAAGTLPAVSFVDPRFETETAPADIPGAPNDTGGGTSGDDHPHGDIRAGDAFLGQIFKALTTGPNWANTVLVINYDEWGGFFDHVAPPRVAASAEVDTDVVKGQSLLGFRVPCIIASPFTKGHPSGPRVYGTPQRQRVPFDHTSVLKLIEWRYGLAPLTARDATPPANGGVGTVLDAFDFRHPDASVPADIPYPLPPAPDPCGANNPFPLSSGPDDTWGALRRSGLLSGWGVA